MQVKVFSQRTTKDGAQLLEDQINAWLAVNPDIAPVFVERIAHPTFGWGHFVVSVWYETS